MRSRLFFFYIRAFRGACECTWKYRSISSKSSARNQGLDKRGEIWISLITCGSIHKGHESILPICEWRCQDIDQVLLHEIIFFVSVFSAEVKCVRQNYFHSDWQTADCSLLVSGRKERKLWSQPALACFMSKATSVSQTPQPYHSQYSSPVEALNLIVDSKSQPVELDNSTIGSYMCRRGERNACNSCSMGWFPCFNAIWYDLWCHVAWRLKFR